MARMKLWMLGVFGGAVIACTGGGGAGGGALESWESSSSTIERADDTREGAPAFREVAPTTRENESNSTESAPGAQQRGGAGAPAASLACAGTFACKEDGGNDEDTIVLTADNGSCVGPEGLVLSADGKVTQKGKEVGSWSASGSGFTATLGKDRVTCTPGTAKPKTSTGSGETSGNTPGANPTPVVDAGVSPPQPGG